VRLRVFNPIGQRFLLAPLPAPLREPALEARDGELRVLLPAPPVDFREPPNDAREPPTALRAPPAALRAPPAALRAPVLPAAREPPADFFAAPEREPALADLRAPAADFRVPPLEALRDPPLEALRDPPGACRDPPLVLRAALLLREPPEERRPAPADDRPPAPLDEPLPVSTSVMSSSAPPSTALPSSTSSSMTSSVSLFPRAMLWCLLVRHDSSQQSCPRLVSASRVRAWLLIVCAAGAPGSARRVTRFDRAYATALVTLPVAGLA
jgi:hypothetical protein